MDIKQYLLDKGIQPHLKGFYYLEKAIDMCVRERTALYGMMKLYKAIGKECGDTTSKVERAIRNALYKSKNRSTNSQFIAQATIDLIQDNKKKK